MARASRTAITGSPVAWPTPVQVHVHGAEASGGVDEFDAVHHPSLAQRAPLVGRHGIRVVMVQVVDGRQEETAGAAGRVGDGVARRRPHHLDHRVNQCAGREVLSCTRFHIGGGFLQQTFVGVAVQVSADRPGFRTDEVHNQLPQQRGLLNLVLRLTENHAEIGAFLAELVEDPAVFVFQSQAVEFGQPAPGDVQPSGENLFAPKPLLTLVGHLEEQQIAELFDVVDVGDAGVTEHVAVSSRACVSAHQDFDEVA